MKSLIYALIVALCGAVYAVATPTVMEEKLKDVLSRKLQNPYSSYELLEGQELCSQGGVTWNGSIGSCPE